MNDYNLRKLETLLETQDFNAIIDDYSVFTCAFLKYVIETIDLEIVSDCNIYDKLTDAIWRIWKRLYHRQTATLCIVKLNSYYYIIDNYHIESYGNYIFPYLEGFLKSLNLDYHCAVKTSIVFDNTDVNIITINRV